MSTEVGIIIALQIFIISVGLVLIKKIVNNAFLTKKEHEKLCKEREESLKQFIILKLEVITQKIENIEKFLNLFMEQYQEIYDTMRENWKEYKRDLEKTLKIQKMEKEE